MPAGHNSGLVNTAILTFGSVGSGFGWAVPRLRTTLPLASVRHNGMNDTGLQRRRT